VSPDSPNLSLQSIPERISIVGNTGSGKTTLAGQLADGLGYPHIELDALHWEPGWQPAPDDVFRHRVRMATAQQYWIVDGNYSRVRDIIYERLQMLVWLDYPLPVNLWRLTRRGIQRVVSQEELWGTGNRESFRGQFLSWDSLYVWAVKSHRAKRERYLSFMKDPDFVHIRVVRLRSPSAANRWRLCFLAVAGRH
jgi:adenylate kinase family enzyme